MYPVHSAAVVERVVRTSTSRAVVVAAAWAAQITKLMQTVVAVVSVQKSLLRTNYFLGQAAASALGVAPRSRRSLSLYPSRKRTVYSQSEVVGFDALDCPKIDVTAPKTLVLENFSRGAEQVKLKPTPCQMTRLLTRLIYRFT